MITDVWNTLLVHPILNILILFYKLFATIGLPGSFGFGIIALTVLIRFLLYPLTTAQMRSMQQMQKLKPEIDRIRKVYKKDNARQQQEMSKLYQKHSVNPASGCLPLLIQSPILIALYSGLFDLFKKSDPVSFINSIVYAPFLHIQDWNPYFLFINLRESPSHWQQGGILLLTIPVITGLLQFVQTKMMTPKIQEALIEKAAEKKGVDSADFANIMQKQMLYFFPIMLGGISYGLPIALAVYWNTFTIFGIMQQYFLNKKQSR